MSLSDKEIGISDEVRFYMKEDVKEFIKELKERIDDDTPILIKDIIDELAGDILI